MQLAALEQEPYRCKNRDGVLELDIPERPGARESMEDTRQHEHYASETKPVQQRYSEEPEGMARLMQGMPGNRPSTEERPQGGKKRCW